MSTAIRAALAAALSLAAAAPAQELLRNGGFEEPGEGVPAGMLMWGDQAFKQPGWYTRDTANPHGGAACLRIHHPAGTAGYLVTSPIDNAIRPKPGARYVISGWARSDRPGRTPVLRLAAFRTLDPFTEGRIQGWFPFEVGSDWRRFSFTVTEGVQFTCASAPVISLCFHASSDRQEERTLWIDDLAVEEQPAPAVLAGLPAAVAARFPAGGGGEPFADGAVVACVGDSITHHGAWTRYLRLFYATRYPERRITVWNTGICGNVAADVVARFPADVAARKPTVVAVMLGMNDVNGPAYGPDAGAEALAPAIGQALATWRGGLGRILALSREAGAAVLLLTPPPYDQDSTTGGAAKTGKAGALERLCAELHELAGRERLPLVDHHHALRLIAATVQGIDRSFTLSPDRVHPAEPGHLVMTWALLRAQGVEPRVSRVAVDAGARTVAAERAAVEGLEVAAGAVGFACTARALPFPIDWRAAQAANLVPFAAELGREELAVAGLAAGTWRLAIDGIAVGSWSAADLAAGIDLGACAETPQYRQALAVAALNDRRSELETGLRNVLFLEADMRRDRVDPAQPAAAGAWLDGLQNWRRGLVPSYRATRPRLAEVEAEIAALDVQMRSAAQPQRRSYRLERQP